MAGSGDKGLPNGKPVGEWGICVEDCHPVDSSVERGGDINGPAAVYGLTKSNEWLRNFAPAEAQDIRIRHGSDPWRYRAAGVLVHRLYGRLCQGGHPGRRREWQPEMAWHRPARRILA
jgi:hypothetical protein